MVSLTIQGAYGRDYKTAQALLEDFVSGKDVRATNPVVGLMGTLISLHDLPKIGVSSLAVRFNKDRDVAVAKVVDIYITLEGVQVLKPKTHASVPTTEQLESWVMDGDCEATDGCIVEPDGHCEHGKPSWLLKLGFM